ncbi:MAG: hypothetical protein RIQ87_199 [Chloroflexota bacterium]|jgi:hypothetical protein
MASSRQPRGFIARRIYQLRHAPRPVFRAVLANTATGVLFALLYLAYDLLVELNGAVDDQRTSAVALVVIATMTAGTLLTYLIVPQPSADGRGSGRSAWSAALGFFASLPVAYIALVVESQIVKPLLLGLFR